jgi:ribosomal RNA assembly protein
MEKAVFSVEEIGRILGKNKSNAKKLEQAFDISLTISKTDGIIAATVKSKKKDEAFNEYTAMNVLEALAFGFDQEAALQLRDPDFMFRRIDIKAYVKGARVSVIKGRIIGLGGKTKRTLEIISECDVVIREHSVGVIGRAENVDIASQAILALIRGAPTPRVFNSLERNMAKIKAFGAENVEKFIEK